MTVKELKEKLENFDDDLVVMVPRSWFTVNGFGKLLSISQGVDEFDSCLLLDDCDEDKQTKKQNIKFYLKINNM